MQSVVTAGRGYLVAAQRPGKDRDSMSVHQISSQGTRRQLVEGSVANVLGAVGTRPQPLWHASTHCATQVASVGAPQLRWAMQKCKCVLMQVRQSYITFPCPSPCKSLCYTVTGGAPGVLPGVCNVNEGPYPKLTNAYSPPEKLHHLVCICGPPSKIGKLGRDGVGPETSQNIKGALKC
ncbi:hypothetical protein HaLaN_30419, partial [Haematococcus lacustris]